MIHCKKHNLDFAHRCPECRKIFEQTEQVNRRTLATGTEYFPGIVRQPMVDSRGNADTSWLLYTAATAAIVAEISSVPDSSVPDSSFTGGGGTGGGCGADGSW